MADYDITEPRLRSVLPFEAAPAEVRLLRRAAVAQLGQWGVPVAVDEVALAVSELATNVLQHVGEGATATLILEWRDERLRVEVHDTSRKVPSLTAAGCGDECGRGLHLLASLAADWGTVLTGVGKAVWCEIAAAASGRAGWLRVERAAGALEGYRSAEGGVLLHGRRGDVCLRESAIELIADLLHWTAARGFDPEDVLDLAQMHYEAEADAA
ncbi:hypothetical protein OK074_6429 [Actinobacteria bacterium OK074]|nr:hypothetical protein OK074_6429 [Actinobacteria bacterium OK074]